MKPFRYINISKTVLRGEEKFLLYISSDLTFNMFLDRGEAVKLFNALKESLNPEKLEIDDLFSDETVREEDHDESEADGRAGEDFR